MDNTNLDIFSMFRDDPELLELLSEKGTGTGADAAHAPPAETPTETQPYGSAATAAPPPTPTPAAPHTPPWGAPAASDAFAPPPSAPAPQAETMDESQWRTIMAELDQLLATASEPITPKLPPSSAQHEFPGGAGGGAGDQFMGAPAAVPGGGSASTGPTDDGDPVVFGTPVSFHLDDLLGSPPEETAGGQPSPPPYSSYDDQSAEAFLSGIDLLGGPEEETEEDKEAENQGKKTRSRSKRILGIVFNIVFILLCLALVVGSAVFAFSSDENKDYLGYRFFNVLTGSMTPQPGGPSGGFAAGDIVIVKVVNAENAWKEIDVMDVITIRNAELGTYLSHRVVDILQEYEGEAGPFFITKGDANPNEDSTPVSAGNLVGKVVLVLPGFGKILDYVRINLVLVIVFIVAFIVLVLLLRSLLLSNAKKRKEKKTKGLSNHPGKDKDKGKGPAAPTGDTAPKP